MSHTVRMHAEICYSRLALGTHNSKPMFALIPGAFRLASGAGDKQGVCHAIPLTYSNRNGCKKAGLKAQVPGTMVMQSHLESQGLLQMCGRDCSVSPHTILVKALHTQSFHITFHVVSET